MQELSPSACNVWQGVASICPLVGASEVGARPHLLRVPPQLPHFPKDSHQRFSDDICRHHSHLFLRGKLKLIAAHSFP